MNSKQADVERPNARDEFFVGYLPVPAGLRVFLSTVIVSALIGAIGMALVASRSQPDPGPGVWDSGMIRAFDGVIQARPYPHIRTLDPRTGAVRSLMLVEVGKFGGGSRAVGYSGKAARVNGWLLERDGRQMIELEPGNAAIQPIVDNADDIVARCDAPTPEPLGRVTLRGEIVDSKCYLGAMKPGEGKTHKECATLCVAGGIPPMLVTWEGGQKQYRLIASPEGGPLDRAAYPLIADPVEITGELDRVGDLLIFRVAVADIRRL